MQVNRPDPASEHSHVTWGKKREQLGPERSVLEKFWDSIPRGTAECKTQTDRKVESDRLKMGFISNQHLRQQQKSWSFSAMLNQTVLPLLEPLLTEGIEEAIATFYPCKWISNRDL